MSAFCNKNPEKARRHIDLEIQKVENSIRSLKSRRNELSPISCLPPEILSQVFISCTPDMPTHKEPLGWTKVTHVSRQWRVTAINCPSLWGSMITTHPQWTEEMLRRSKMADLVLYGNLHYPTIKKFEAIRLVLEHITRIKDLKILAPRYTFGKVIANLPVDAPLLQSLSFTIIPDDPPRTDEHFTLPEKFFSGDISHLQRLELNGCNLIWDSAMFNGLTVLKICGTLPLKRPTTSQVIDVLEKMPALEFLHLQEALPLVDNEATIIKPADRVISLSRLSHIIIVSTVPECTNLFNHITFPRDATCSLRIRDTEITGHDFSTILNTMSNSKVSIRTLHILSIPPATLVIQGWVNNDNFHRDIPHIEFFLSWMRPRKKVVESVMTAACNVLSLTHLESLYLSYIEGVGQKTWVTLFGSLPKIQLVYLAQGFNIRLDSTFSFLLALRQKPMSSKKAQLTSGEGKSGPDRCKSRTLPVCFPSLQILTMEDIHFRHGNFNYLRGCLVERHERKAELQELRLVSCHNLIESDVKLLKEFVVDVKWDEWQKFPSDIATELRVLTLRKEALYGERIFLPY